MELLKIFAVSYLNTFPFVYGLKQSGLLKNFSLALDVPSICAEKLKSGSVDISLVPVGALPEISQFHYCSEFCIGAVGEVKTVLLLSKVPMERIKHIYLDFDSRTSVALVKVLARQYWKISPIWENLPPGNSESMCKLESVVAIGDKTFEIRSDFPYVYDLSEAWNNYTGLPFAFAVWISREKLTEDILLPFNRALAFGITHKAGCIDYFKDKLPTYSDCLGYLENNISYDFDANKKRGLELFLKHIQPSS